jgi:hypothetical protein
MVDYDESDLIAKMQQEVDLKKQYEMIKIEEQKQIINSQKQKVLSFYNDYLQKRHPAYP